MGALLPKEACLSLDESLFPTTFAGTCRQRLWASTFRLERASRDESRFDNHADLDSSAQVLKANDFKAVLDVWARDMVTSYEQLKTK